MPIYRPMIRTASNGKPVVIGHYHRRKRTEKEMEEKRQARRTIIQRANLIAARMPANRAPFTLRSINQAVAVVRHHQAVPPRILVMAGFLPRR